MNLNSSKGEGNSLERRRFCRLVYGRMAMKKLSYLIFLGALAALAGREAHAISLIETLSVEVKECVPYWQNLPATPSDEVAREALLKRAEPTPADPTFFGCKLVSAIQFEERFESEGNTSGHLQFCSIKKASALFQCRYSW